jgi:hypothetical protein
VCVCLDWDGGVGRFATTTSTAPLFYCLRSGICFRVVAVAISANRLLGLRVFSRTLPFVFPPFSPHRIRPLPRPRPAADSGRAAADSAAKSRLGKAARSDSWGFAADLVGFWGIPDPVFVSQGLVHEEAVLIWRGGFSTAWPLSGRLRPASHVSNPKLLAEQLCAPRGAVWQVC